MRKRASILVVGTALFAAIPAHAFEDEFINPDLNLENNIRSAKLNLECTSDNFTVKTWVDAKLIDHDDVISLKIYNLARGQWYNRASQYKQLSLKAAHRYHYRWVGQYNKDPDKVMTGDLYYSQHHWNYTELLLGLWNPNGLILRTDSKCRYRMRRWGAGVSAKGATKDTTEPSLQKQ